MTFYAITLSLMPNTVWAKVMTAALVLAPLLTHAQEPDTSAWLPSFAELEAAGAVIGEVRVDRHNIFELDDPRENNWAFRLANRLHIMTRPGVIERELLFKPGERVSVRLIEETERLLHSNRYLYDVNIKPVAYRDGIVDIEVSTHDTWTLDPGVSFGRSGGVNSGGISLKEYNLFGTGIALGISRSSNAGRSSTEFNIADNHVFGGWTAASYAYATHDEGGASHAFSLVRPFYALDERWAAGFTAASDDIVEPVYDRGVLIGEYRHYHKAAEVFRGWSRGLVAGWTRRFSVGLTYQDDKYELAPGRSPPGPLPDDLTLVAPFMRYEVIEDGFRKLRNRDLIERPEFFALGFQSQVQLGYAASGLGSTRNLWLYSGSISNGYELMANRILLTSASVSGRYGDGRVENQVLGGSMRFYAPRTRRTLFFATISGDISTNADVPNALQLGGDNGLRGYPLSYQTGTKRVLLSLEQRAYADWYPLRLFRVGGAVFVDVGRAWGAEQPNAPYNPWLSDVGVGLRFLSARSAFGNVLHLDLAFPLNAGGEVKSVQWLVKSKVRF
jgi:hypothetical protein